MIGFLNTERFSAPLFAGALAMCLVPVTQASASWLEPAGGWEVDYQASSGYLPDSGNTNPSWTRSTYVQTNIYVDPTINEDALYIDRSGSHNPNFRSNGDWGQGHGDDQMTVDFGLRMIGESEDWTQDDDFVDGNWQFQLVINRPANTSQVAEGNASQAAILRVGQNGIFVGAPAGENETANVALGTTWHDFRLHIDWEAGVIAVFLDGGDEAVVSGVTDPRTAVSSNQIQFGHSGGPIRGSAFVSHVRFTNNELAAVPEPASLMLLGVGGLAMLARRRSSQHA